METQIEILVDLSSSMGNPLYKGIDNERPKIEITKNLLIKKLIPTLDFNSKISLHTFKASGEYKDADFQTILDDEYTSKIEITEKVNKIRRPAGWTPIAAAIDFAIERLNEKESFDKKIIILTDGMETCHGDYLESARQATYSGVNCKIFIIGVGELTETAVNEFKEIADITDGKFVNIGIEHQAEEEIEQELQDLFNTISLDTVFNIIDSYYESDKTKNLILSEIFKDYEKRIFVIPNILNIACEKQETLIIEFFDSIQGYPNLGKALNQIKEFKGNIKNVVIVLNEWNQENANVLRKYSPLLKDFGVNKLDIKILGLPLANPNFIKDIFGNRQGSNVINIIGDNNFVNTGINPKYNSGQTDVFAKLIEVIRVVEENQTINQSERKKYEELLIQLTKEVLKKKDKRLSKSIIDLILAGLGPLDSMTTIWLNVKEILKSFFE